MKVDKYIGLNGFTSRRKAYDMIENKRILVNGKLANFSTKIKDGDEISIMPSMKENVNVLMAAELAERDIPEYLDVDQKAQKGKYIRGPKLADVPYPVQMEPHLVIEFYSR